MSGIVWIRVVIHALAELLEHGVLEEELGCSERGRSLLIRQLCRLLWAILLKRVKEQIALTERKCRNLIET